MKELTSQNISRMNAENSSEARTADTDRHLEMRCEKSNDPNSLLCLVESALERVCPVVQDYRTMCTELLPPKLPGDEPEVAIFP